MYTNKIFLQYSNQFYEKYDDLDYHQKLIIEGGKEKEKELILINDLLQLTVSYTKLHEYMQDFNKQSSNNIAQTFAVSKLYGFREEEGNTLLYTFKELTENQQLLAVKTMYVPLYLKYINPEEISIKQWQNIHEIVISLLINYKVSNILLNFPLVYGFKTSGPTLVTNFDNKYKVITPHESDKISLRENYLYSELLQAVDLYNLLNGLELVHFLSIWYQLCYTLLYMQDHYEFTHYDLHASNVMIEFLQQPIVLCYPCKNKTYYLKTKYLVRIIDVASSYIKVDGVEYGLNDPDTMWLGRRKVFNRFYDIYLLLCYIFKSHYTMDITLQSDIVKALRYFMTFFNNEDIFEDIIEKQENWYFAYFPTASETQQTMLDFIEHMAVKYSIIQQDDILKNQVNIQQFEHIRYKNLRQLKQVQDTDYLQLNLNYYLNKFKKYVKHKPLFPTNLTFYQIYYQLMHNPLVSETIKNSLVIEKDRLIEYNNSVLQTLPEMDRLITRQELNNLYSYTFSD